MTNRNIFAKHIKSNVKLSTRYDAEGCEVQVEKREDVDATIKEQETYDILIKAGYYRACIKGLSAFDKVVGGMTWCIECSNYDVDVDLLFHENLTIGQKIALVEKIVAILPQMKCPYLIEPHQIQGLEFLSIYRVIEWLVKESVEKRAERTLHLRQFAIGQFRINFQYKQDIEDLRKLHVASKVLKNIQEIYYTGQKEDVHHGVNNRASLVKLTPTENIEENETNNCNQILLLKKNCEQINRELETDVKQLNGQNQLNALQVEKKTFEREVIQNEKGLEIHLENIEEKRKIKDDIVTENEELKNRLADYKMKESQTSPELLKKVQTLLKQHDDLKKDETDFKEKSQSDFNKLQQTIEKLEIFCAQQPEELKAQIRKRKERLKMLKLHLAKRNRAITVIERQLDNIPDRTELSQYQRRFHELHNEVSAKHLETKQYYILYNTLSDTKRYMEKELSLLNSICGTYDECKMKVQDFEQFIQQFERIVSEVKQTEAKISSKLDREKLQIKMLNDELQSMQELQSEYTAAVVQLTQECQRCTTLQQHLESLRRKSSS